MKKSSIIFQNLCGCLIGGITAAISFVPVTLAIIIGLSWLLFIGLKIENFGNSENLFFIRSFWWPAIISGSIGGLVGASLRDPMRSWLRVILKSWLFGIAAMLVVVLIFCGITFYWWM